MHGRLILQVDGKAERAFDLADVDKATIGRGTDARFQLADPSVSRKHCEIQTGDGMAVLLDLNSSGGTFVNGKQIHTYILQPDDSIAIGPFTLKYEMAQPSQSSSANRPTREKTNEPLDELIGANVGRYRVDEWIARGSTGGVFRAHDEENQQDVAFKVLWPDFAKDEEERQRFVRAMRAVLPIQHQHLVQIYNAGKNNRYCWIAMELIHGQSLAHLIAERGVAGTLDWRHGFRVARDVADALTAAFHHGVLHRNIKPSNVLVQDYDGVVKLGDLMLAKALEGTNAAQITKPGQLVGDLAFMAPERTTSAEAVDTRSDIYGLGATVYAVLTGRPPFAGKSLPDVVKAIRTQPPTKPRQFQKDIPEVFEELVLKMLAKRPEDRPQTPGDLLEALVKVERLRGWALESFQR